MKKNIFHLPLKQVKKQLRARGKLFEFFGKHSPGIVELQFALELKTLYAEQTRTVVSIFLMLMNSKKVGLTRYPDFERLASKSNLDANEIVKGLSTTDRAEIKTQLEKMMDDIHAHCLKIASELGIEFEAEKPDIDKIISAGG